MCIHIHIGGESANMDTAKIIALLEQNQVKLNQIGAVLGSIQVALATAIATITTATATTNKGIAEVSGKIDTLAAALGNVDLPEDATAALADLATSATNLQTAADAQKAAADALDAIVPDVAPPAPAETAPVDQPT